MEIFFNTFQDVSDAVEHVLILAATNTPYALDQALRRRFDMRIYIPLPDYKARERIFEIQIGKTPSMIDKNGLESLAKGTKGFSGADISSYVKDALYHSIRATLREKFFIKTEDNVWVPCQDAGVSDKKSLRELEKLKQNSKIQVPKITLDDFKKVSKRHKRTVNEADLNLLEKFDNEFGARFSDPGRNVERRWFLFFIFILILIFILIFRRHPYYSGFFCFGCCLLSFF
ncbi:protein SUPPRESSOR OF K(+) TRANSPORT GROWTH DEFECT 1 [Quercus suber]|uniref:protein SUPPRESSOR OF K(+) TRANSPORT GROWTH DEFECT 1 n=1 Tax=Quercus suber TaxID=58331 RepID=UPI0032E01915